MQGSAAPDDAAAAASAELPLGVAAAVVALAAVAEAAAAAAQPPTGASRLLIADANAEFGLASTGWGSGEFVIPLAADALQFEQGLAAGSLSFPGAAGLAVRPGGLLGVEVVAGVEAGPASVPVSGQPKRLGTYLDAGWGVASKELDAAWVNQTLTR